MLLMMYMMISLPPCSQVCSGTWWCLSCWNSPAIPLWYSPSFISCGFLLLSLSLSFCPLMVVVHSHSSELSKSLSGFSGRKRFPTEWEKCGGTSVSRDTAHLRVGGSLPVTEVLSFAFSLAFGHPVSLFLGRQQFVVSVAAASSPRSVLPYQFSQTDEQSSEWAALTFQKAIPYRGHEMTQLL